MHTLLAVLLFTATARADIPPDSDTDSASGSSKCDHVEPIGVLPAAAAFAAFAATRRRKPSR